LFDVGQGTLTIAEIEDALKNGRKDKPLVGRAAASGLMLKQASFQ